MDAMELMLSRNMRFFVVASSDGDFTHLATKLREHGATVIGVGEAKAPRSFRAFCTDFVEIGKAPAVRLVPKPAAIVTNLDLNIPTMIAAHSTKGAGMRIAELAPKMHSQHGVQISTYTERSWRAYLVSRPSLYELNPRGPEDMVRFRPEGFNHAA
ncbi:NYN domain-containing protein [Sulfitobacter sp.]|uniref:NYN domain-containing protein n=1 Tax=Sulfitobacter sp. TaxID=1903071 RepID=UPI0030022E21